MLVLARTDGQEICIGPDIVITVLERRGEQTRIGIRAPKEMRVDRREVRDRVDAELAADRRAVLKSRESFTPGA
jgi:carbon storage regulator CsrA